MAKGIKTGGRAAGTPNRKTQTLLDKCEAKGIDIFDAMLELAIAAQGSEKFKMLSELAQYAYPKRKAIEHKHDGAKIRILEIRRPDGTGDRIVGEEE